MWRSEDRFGDDVDCAGEDEEDEEEEDEGDMEVD